VNAGTIGLIVAIIVMIGVFADPVPPRKPPVVGVTETICGGIDGGPVGILLRRAAHAIPGTLAARPARMLRRVRLTILAP
jgi:hypothetical protein